MRNVLSVFVRDVRRLLRVPAAWVIVLGLAVLPAFYAWVNILANWDPYQNTSTVPVAVVVEDRGAEVPGMGEVNAGDMVRERLEENHQLGWTFVDQDEALEGVRAGRYYAAFVIPPDFTSTLAGVLDGHPTQARIGYYVNEKANAIAPKVTDTGAGELESQIADEFASVVGKTVTEKLQGALGGASEDLDAAGSSAQDDLTQTADLLETAIRTFGLDADATIRALLESLDCCGFETPSLLPPHIDSIIGERVRDGNFHSRDEAIRHYVLLGLYHEQSATGGCFL